MIKVAMVLTVLEIGWFYFLFWLFERISRRNDWWATPTVLMSWLGFIGLFILVAAAWHLVFYPEDYEKQKGGRK